MSSKKLTKIIFASLVFGVLVGYFINIFGNQSGLPVKYASYASILMDVFMRLIKMIIAPLVFSTLVVGLARMGSASEIGRIGCKTFGWFFFMSAVSMAIGLIMVNLLQPGVATGLSLPDGSSVIGLNKTSLNLVDFARHAFPASFVEAMAKNEILQIVVFSLFFGVAIASLGDYAQGLVSNLEVLSHVMLKITGAVMKLAPIAVFAAVSTAIAKNGLAVLAIYGKFILYFYLALLMLWLTIIFAGFAVLRVKVFRLISLLRQPLLLSFTTASSEAAYPVTLEQVERFGCKNKIASFVLPMGYSFNLDGSMMYCTFAIIFIAQVYGINMPIAQQLLMLLVLMVTSKGIAGVPRASLVVVAATLAQFDLPEAGILLIFGIDHFLDMGRSATNVLGNGVATAIISKWEGAWNTKSDESFFA